MSVSTSQAAPRTTRVCTLVDAGTTKTFMVPGVHHMSRNMYGIWLRLSKPAGGLSNFMTRGRFEGWHYASPATIAEMFRGPIGAKLVALAGILDDQRCGDNWTVELKDTSEGLQISIENGIGNGNTAEANLQLMLMEFISCTYSTPDTAIVVAGSVPTLMLLREADVTDREIVDLAIALSNAG